MDHIIGVGVGGGFAAGAGLTILIILIYLLRRRLPPSSAKVLPGSPQRMPPAVGSEEATQPPTSRRLPQLPSWPTWLRKPQLPAALKRTRPIAPDESGSATSQAPRTPTERTELEKFVAPEPSPMPPRSLLSSILQSEALGEEDISGAGVLADIAHAPVPSPSRLDSRPSSREGARMALAAQREAAREQMMAMRLQGSYRVHSSRREVSRRKMERIHEREVEAAARSIQGMYRRKQACERMDAIREEVRRHKAAKAIQRFWRVMLWRKVLEAAMPKGASAKDRLRADRDGLLADPDKMRGQFIQGRIKRQPTSPSPAGPSFVQSRIPSQRSLPKKVLDL
jgi:hypothetical protein